MSKLLVETTGDFMLVDYDQKGLVIEHSRPTVTNPTTFVQTRTSLGQLRVVAELTDEATDEEFAKYVKESDGDIELAVDSFKTAFAASNEKTTIKQPEAKRRGPKANETPEG